MGGDLLCFTSDLKRSHCGANARGTYRELCESVADETTKNVIYSGSWSRITHQMGSADRKYIDGFIDIGQTMEPLCVVFFMCRRFYVARNQGSLMGCSLGC